MDLRHLEYKQSRLASFMEAFMAALIAAPTALLLNNALLDLWANNLSDPHIKSTYLAIGWLSFFLHSMIWKYVLRRMFTKYGFKTEPRYLLSLVKDRFISRK